MHKIVTKPLREGIKLALIKKYIDSLGIEMPRVPTLPHFEAPELPDISKLRENMEEATRKLLDDKSKEDLYTPEYIKAEQEYVELVQKAQAKYDGELENCHTEKNKIEEKRQEDPTFGTNELLELKKRENEAKATLKREKKEARKKSNIDNVDKFKKINVEDKMSAITGSENETEAKREKAKSVALAVMQSAMFKQYEAYIRKELSKVERTIRETVDMYNNTKKLFTEHTESIKKYFNDEAGSEMVERECDKIDSIWDNLVDSVEEVGTDFTTLFAKVAIPSDIVSGTAVGVPNPGYKISVFLENFKKLLTDITKLANYIKDIISTAKKIGFDILEKVKALAEIADLVEKFRGDADKQFRNTVKRLQRRTKWTAEINKKDEEDDDEYLTKTAGYKYADLEVNYEKHDIKLLGYKCYCTKNKEFIEGYEKRMGPFTDEKGKQYYYLTEEDMVSLQMYEVGEEDDETTATASYDYTSGTTTLALSDNRIVTIDYLASSGEIIRLNDGTVVNVL